jgi:integrase
MLEAAAAAGHVAQPDNAVEGASTPILAGVAMDARRTAMAAVGRPGTAGDVARVYPWHELTAADVAALARGLAVPYSPSVASATLAAVRRVVAELVTLKAAAAAVLVAVHSVRRRKDRRAAGSVAAARRRQTHTAGGDARADVSDPSGAFLVRLTDAIAADGVAARAARDGAMIALLYGGGLRRAEAAALTWADVDAAAGVVHVRHGKGGKARAVPLSAAALRRLDAWRAVCGPAGAVLRHVRKGVTVGAGLSPAAIGEALGRLAGRAGVPGLRPHDLRRGYVTALLDVSHDLDAVAALVGHEHTTTTARYDLGKARRAADVARRLPAPGL